MMKFLLILMLFFLLRFVFRYVLPVVRVARNATRSIRHLQDSLQQQAPPAYAAQQPPYKRPRPAKEDYIDFEEIK